MFTNHCQECDKTQLIFPSQVTAVVGTATGVEVEYTCWCGATQSHLFAPAESIDAVAA